jgi:hypothetical protein
METPVFDTICSGDSVLWRGNYYKTNGHYQQTYGFDSAFYLNLIVKPAYINEQKVEFCSGNSYWWHGQKYFTSGTYTVYNTTTQGCDSIDRLVLKVYPDFTNLITTDLCAGDSMAFGGNFIKTSGVYDDSLTGIHGCDSVVRLTVRVFPTDTTVTKHGDSLVAASTTAAIRYIDCLTGNYVYGAGGRVFVPSYPSVFAAEITENSCTYTTRCFDFRYLGIGSPNGRESIVVRPNPAKDKVIIESRQTNIGNVELLDITGKVLYSVKAGHKTLTIDLSDYSPGSYVLRITTVNNVFIRKLVKK